MTWGKIALWGVAVAMTAGFGPAAPQTPVVVRAAAWASCVNVPSVRGPGALIVVWFGRQAG